MQPDFNLVMGATGEIHVEIYDSGGSSPVDISTATEITFKARHNGDPTTPLDLDLRKSTGGIVFTTDGTDGQFDITASVALIATLDYHNLYWYSCFLTIEGIVYEVCLYFGPNDQKCFGVLLGVS